MPNRTVRRLSVGAAVIPVTMALAACGSQVLDNPDQDVSNAIYNATGQRPKTVSCPSNINAKVGTKFRCTLTASDGTKIGATVTETSISNGKVQMHIQVDSKPQS